MVENLIAHRGLYNEYICENTLLSFYKAMEKNYIIELDVRLSKDKKVIVFHDISLKRLSGINKFVENSTYDELKKIKLKGKYQIPLLEDVLNLVKGKIPIIIDVKGNIENYELEQELIKTLKDYHGSIAIQSFNPKTIKWLKKRFKCCYGLIVFNYLNLKIVDRLFLAKKYDFVVCYLKYVKDKKIQVIRKKKIVIGWTINNLNELLKYKDFCDNFICENLP